MYIIDIRHRIGFSLYISNTIKERKEYKYYEWSIPMKKENQSSRNEGE